VLVIAAVLLGWTGGREPAPPPPGQGARLVPIDTASVTCRGTGGSGSPPTGVLSTLVDGGPLGAAAESNVAATELGSGRDRRDLLPSAYGALVSRQLGGSDPGVRLDVQGPAAGALEAWSASSASPEQGAGLAVARCARPERDGWFLAAGSTVDQDGTILLSNPAGTSAVADVSFLTAEGDLRPTATQGLVLEPGSQLALELSELIAGTADVAVQVEAQEGRVTAQVLDRWTDNRLPAGTEWIPQAHGAATRALLTGLPTSVSAQQLVVANPGDLGAVVNVQVVGPDTTYRPEGLGDVTVPARSTASVPVPSGLDGRLVSLLVESDRSVFSTVRSITNGPRPDVAHAVGASALTAPTAAPIALPPGVPSSPEGPLLAIVATGDADGSARLRVLDAEGQGLATLDVDVPAGITTVVNLSPRSGDLGISPRRAARVAQVVVRPAGAVGAALVHAPDAAGLSVLPLESIPSTVVAPTVLPRALSRR